MTTYIAPDTQLLDSPPTRQTMRSRPWRIILVATSALLCGCGHLSGPDAGDAGVGDRAGQSVRGPEFVRFDGFEGDSVASFWRPGNAGEGRTRRGPSRFRPAMPEPAPGPSGLRSVRVTSSKRATTANRPSGPSSTPAGTMRECVEFNELCRRFAGQMREQSVEDLTPAFARAVEPLR